MPRLPKLIGALFCAFSFLVATEAVAQCSRAPLPARAAEVVPVLHPNQNLFNQAILSEINVRRCQAGLGPIQIHSGLARVAMTHATWMAKQGVLSHRSTVSGQSSVQNRVLASGYNARRGSENIGTLPRLPKLLTSIDQSRSCRKVAKRAKRMPNQTYQQVAATIVDMWMASKAHRKNVLDQNIRSVGSAISYSPVNAPCGQFYLSQNFAG